MAGDEDNAAETVFKVIHKRRRETCSLMLRALQNRIDAYRAEIEKPGPPLPCPWLE
jgi:hypothetical protein